MPSHHTAPTVRDAVSSGRLRSFLTSIRTKPGRFLFRLMVTALGGIVLLLLVSFLRFPDNARLASQQAAEKYEISIAYVARAWWHRAVFSVNGRETVCTWRNLNQHDFTMTCEGGMYGPGVATR